MGKALARFKRSMILLQTGWSILGITLILILIMEAGLRMTFALRDHLTLPASPDPRILSEGYGGATWLSEHYREIESLQERWQPYVYFRPKAFQGKTITIGPDGLRATLQPGPPAGELAAKKPLKLLMLGGSSLWGFGARDDHTIPSLLARKLHDRGVKAEVKNLADLGYVSTQEVICLLRELQQGYRPDVVVFYDGVNDTTSAVLSGEAGLTTNEDNRRREFNLLNSPGRLVLTLGGKLLSDSGSLRVARAIRSRLGRPALGPNTSLPDETMRRLAADVADRYAANVKLVETLARSYGFRPFFFWQPTIFNKAELTAVEREEAERYAWTETAFRAVYEKIRAVPALNADPAFRDLSAIFAAEQKLVFIDYCHTTESANARIAEQIDTALAAASHESPRAGE
jgi:lysophospholipase L1-like esterase